MRPTLLITRLALLSFALLFLPAAVATPRPIAGLAAAKSGEMSHGGTGYCEADISVSPLPIWWTRTNHLAYGAISTRSCRGRTATQTLLVSHDCAGLTNCYTSIGNALEAASHGDVIRVAQGSYNGPVVIAKSVALEGGWNDDFSVWNREIYITTLDARRSGPTVRVEGAVSPTIEGFVITGGDDTEGLGQGGGIRVTGTGPVTIRYNVITDNVACAASTCSGQGGGIAVYGAAAVVWDNTIVSNTAHAGDTGVGDGGGVFVEGAAEVTLMGNRILSNTASLTGSGNGGGVYADGVTLFTDNLVQGNLACPDGDGSGGGIYAIRLDSAEHNTISYNEAQRGGGIYLGESEHAQNIDENVIADNTASGAATADDGGGGIASASRNAQIAGNRFLGNTAAQFGGGLLLLENTQNQVKWNTFQGNSAAFGGGVFHYTADGTFAHNRLVNNTAIGRGGGLYLYAGSAPVVDANLVMSNAVTAGEGGGVSIRNSDVPLTLTNQIIAHNDSLGDGAGIYVHSASKVFLVNNTVVDNGTGVDAEGVALLEGSRLMMLNNIVVGHGVGVSVSADSTATLDYTAFFDNVADTLGLGRGPHHYDDDPQFEDRAGGDYHLRITSPLIGLCTPSAAVAHDYDADLRPLGKGCDVGADEAPVVLTAGPAGTTLLYADTPGISTTLEIPVGALTQTTIILYSPKAAEVVTDVPPGLGLGGHVYDLSGLQTDAPIARLAKAMTISVAYSDEQVRNLVEASLAPYRRVEGAWGSVGSSPEEGYALYVERNVLAAYLVRFGRIAHFGTAREFRLYLPLMMRNGS